jgi:hypothetical protein
MASTRDANLFRRRGPCPIRNFLLIWYVKSEFPDNHRLQDISKFTYADTKFLARLSMCVDEIPRAHTVLTSMAIRIAECMGLHRDPTEYGFAPIECHVRRLIWYKICYLDLKTSEVQGPRPYISYDGYATQLPIDDTTSKSPCLQIPHQLGMI